MPQSTAMLTQMGVGYAPFAEGIPHGRRTGFEGLPVLDRPGPAGLLAQLALAPALFQTMGRTGMVPMGVTGDQNVYDIMRKMQYTQTQMETMRVAAGADRESFFRTFRGMAALTGTPFGAEQRRAATALAGRAATMAPVFAEIMPEFMDQLGGQRGSAAVMAKRMIDAGRYRIDPVTGRMGMSAETTGHMARRLFEDLYADENIAQMHGIRAGQLGDVYQHLQNRGLLTSFAASRGYGGFAAGDPRGQLQQAADAMRRSGPDGARQLQDVGGRLGLDLGRGVESLSGADLDKLAGAPEVASRLRAFDVERVKRSLQSYAKAVSAMRDIFGDMGRPNAPMQEIIQGLEALSMGSMAQLDPSRLPGLVRQTYNLAKQTGVTMDAALVLQQHAGTRAQQMGLEPVFGVHAAQGSLGFGGAYRAQGHAGFTAWGAMDATQVTQLDANLRVQAAGSNMANRLAAVMRLRDTLGGFQAGSDAERLAAAVGSGLNQFVDASGRLRSLGSVSDAEFVRILRGARGAGGLALGLSENDIRDVLSQRSTNREYVDRYNIDAVVRRAQGVDELHPFVGGRMQEVLTSRLRDALVAQGASAGDAFRDARAAARDVSGNVTRRMFALSTEEFADTASRNQAVADIIEEELRLAGRGDALAGMSGEERRRFLSATAERFYGHANRAIQGSMYRAFGNLQNVHRLTNEATLNEADRQQMQAAFTSRLQEAMAPLGRGTILSRAVEALQNARPDDPNGALEVITKALGGVRAADINQALLKPLTEIKRQQDAAEALRSQISQTQDPTRRADLTRQLDTAVRELGAQVQTVAKLGERHGLFATPGVDPQDLDRTLRSGTDMIRTVAELHGVRTGAGMVVDRAELDAVLNGGPVRMTARDAQAVLTARRLSEIERLRTDPAAQVSDATRAAYAAAAQEVRRRGPGMNDAQVAAAALAVLRQHAGDFSDPASQNQLFELLSGQAAVTDPEEARALIMSRRQSVPLTPTREMIDQAVKQHKGFINEAEAAEFTAAGLRAARFGISVAAVDARQAQLMGEGKDIAAPGSWQFRLRAMEQLVAEQQNRQLTVTPEDRQRYLDENRARLPGGITQEMVDAFRKNVPGNKDATDEEARQRILDRMVLGQREVDMRKRFQAFWGSEDGAAFREQVDHALQDFENIGQQLISPQMVQRLGTRAISMRKTLHESQQRLRDLALYHTGGDLARLFGGDLDVTIATREGQETGARVRAETQEAYRRMRLVAEELRGTVGQAGTQWELGDERHATRRVLSRLVAEGKMTPAQMDEALRAVPTREERLRIRARQAQMGTEGEARRILGLPQDLRDLSEWQKAKIMGVRFGAGVEQEIVGAVGAGRWATLSEAERANLLDALREGTAGNRDRALKLLGLDRLTRNLTSEEEEKVQAAMVGFRSRMHARQLHGFGVNADLNEAQERQVTAVYMGIATEEFARFSMSMPDPKLPPEVLREIEQYRELAGNKAEAERLMGVPYAEMTPAQRKEWEQLVREVGVARRLSPEQNAMLDAREKGVARLKALAAEQGASAEELELFAGMAGASGRLTDEQRQRLAGRALVLTPEQRALAAVQKGVLGQAGQQLAGARAALANAVRELNDPGVPAGRKEQIRASLPQLRDAVSAAEAKRDAGHAALSGAAGVLGVTTTELAAGRRSGRKLERLTDAEARRVDAARKAHARASARLRSATNQISDVKAQIDRVTAARGMDAAERARRLADLQARLGRAQEMAASAMVEQQEATAGVEQLAEERGVTAAELLRQDRGFLTEDRAREVGRLHEARKAADDQVAALAGALGASREDVLGGARVDERLAEAQKRAAREAAPDPAKMTRKILQAYGLTPTTGDQPGAAESRIAALMNSAAGRGMAERILSTQQTLSSFARQGKFVTGDPSSQGAVNAGIGAMADEYFRIVNGDLRENESREQALKKFQERLGLDFDRGQLTGRGQRDWQNFQRAMQFQQQTRFLQAGPGRGLSDANNMYELYRDAMQGGELRPAGPAGAADSQNGPMQIQGHLTGTFTIEGNSVNMVARAGGHRNFTVPSA